MTICPQSGLVATNVRCQKLLEQIPHLAWLMTDSSSVVWAGWGEILTVNQRWYEYIGKEVAEPILDVGIAVTRSTRPWIFAEILHAEDRDRFLHSWAEARRCQEPLAIKLQLQRRSGDWEWFTVKLEPDCDESGQTIWICTAIRLGGQAAIPSHQQPLHFLEALLDNASDGIVACDADGQLVLFNRMAQIFHGLPPEPIAPEEWASYYDLCDRDGIRTLPKSEIPLFRALQGESVVSQEITIKSKQGEARSLLANGTAIYSHTGEKLGAVVLMRDITAENQTLSALQHSEQKFRAIFDGAFQFIGLIEPNGTLVEANQPALQFGGMKAEEAIGRPLWDIPGWKFAPAAQQQLQASISRAAQGEFIRYEVEVMGAGDVLVPLDFSLMPILDPAGEVTLIIPEGRDIRQIKQSESERLRSQLYSERLSVALRGGKAGAWNWDLSHRHVVLWSPEFERLFDYEPGSSKQLYSEWRDRVHPDDLERVETLLQETIDRKSPEFRYEYRIVWRDGQIRWMDAIGELHTDELDNLRMSGLVYDITDRKQLELLGQQQSAELQRLNTSLLLTQQHLEERNRELDRFVYIAAHDLKAPLRSVANLSEWIEEDTIDLIPAANQQQFQLLRQRVNRMDALIEGLLQYARLGRDELAIETVDVAQLVAETIDSLSLPVGFEIEILSPLPTLTAKRILLSQVFANLLSNAIKHQDRADGRIEISVEDLGDRYQFAIADDGPGIPEGESRERIFEMFGTLQPSNSSNNTGIGLAIVKKIVESEGGQIWLDCAPIPARTDAPPTLTLRQRDKGALPDFGLLSARTEAVPTAHLRQRVQGACFLFTCLKTVK